MASREEQETTVNFMYGEETLIYSAYGPHIRRMHKDDRFILVQEWKEDDEVVAAQFSVAPGMYDPIKGAKRKRVLTEEQRVELSERMKKIHDNR